MNIYEETKPDSGKLPFLVSTWEGGVLFETRTYDTQGGRNGAVYVILDRREVRKLVEGLYKWLAEAPQ